MRRMVSLNAPSYLPTLLGSGSPRASLLATLHDYGGHGHGGHDHGGHDYGGHGHGGPDAGTVNPIEALEQAMSGETTQVALVAAKPQVKRDIAQFTQALATAKTPEQLLANPAALKVLLTANGLGDQTGNTMLATRALLSDPSEFRSQSEAPNDTRWLNVNQTYAFAEKGLAVLKDPGTVNAIANGYAEELWRTHLDETTPGLSTALDFQQRASTITGAGQIFGDPTFRVVITTVLGLPEQIGSQPPNVREQAISNRLDLTRFKDPGFIAQLTQRYLIAVQQAATPQAETAEPDLTTPDTEFAGLVI
jgi:hypothetical protein